MLFRSNSERHIPFSSCFNFRDLGGHRTQDGRSLEWRRLYRSGEIQRLTQDEADYAREILDVSTVIDLRRSEEVSIAGIGILPISPVNYHSVPLDTEDEDLGEALNRAREFPLPLGADYLEKLNQPAFGNRLIEVLGLIAEASDGATVFHCSAGKDRAGMVAAAVLSVVGVSNEDIVADYAMSARYMPKQIDHWWKNDPASSPYFERLPPYTYDARPETMEYVLDDLSKEYGSMQAYVKAHGGDDTLIQQLRDRLLK